MICIATFNGMNFLPRLLDSIEKYGWYGQRVLIVDTGSTDEEFLKYLDELDHSYDDNRIFSFEIYVVYSKDIFGDKNRYDTGAYLTAYLYERNSEDLFIFMQDSTEIKSEDWFPAYMGGLRRADVCAWLTFTDPYEDQRQVDFVKGYFGTSEYKKGIFAPMFAIRKKAMGVLYEKTNIGKVEVTSKWFQQAMERGWAVAIEQAGLTLTEIDNFSWDRIKADDYKHFKKYIALRQ